MKKSTFNTPLVGGGFLLGTARHRRSPASGKECLRAGHRVRHAHQELLTRTWSSRPRLVDDMVAEAAYITQSEAAADNVAE